MSGSGNGGWVLRYDGFDPHVERGVEGAFSVSNGSFGVRAAVEEGSAASNATLLVAGVFVPTAAPAAQTLLAIDDPAIFTMLIDGQHVQVPLVDTREHRRVLDLRDGTMRRSWSFVDERGRRWLLESSRAASATESGVYIHRAALRLEAGDAAQVALRFHDDVSAAAVEPGALRLVTTADVPGFAPVRTRRRVRGNANVQEGGLAASVSQASPLNIDSLSLIAPAAPGSEDMREAGAEQVDEAHRDEWRRRWEGCDVEIGGHAALQQAVRFALYHLLSASPVNEGRSSVGARNLSGEAYHGHVFWDTEIFVLPALTFSRPEAARSALLYRRRTLDAARDRARSSGYKGALYAWESTDTGEDRTPSSAILPDGAVLRILNGEQEHHISADVAYGVMQYWRATGDDPFMRDDGAEVVFECARFWASRLTPADGAYVVRKVIGPDEYHTGVDNDAYTNAMASWTLRTAVELAGDAIALPAVRKLAIDAAEASEWRLVAAGLKRSDFSADDVHEQFDGFFELGEVDVASFRASGVPIDVALGGEAVERARAIKQADVLMTALLLPDLWTEASLRRNFEYYEPLTAHGSSLSPPVHALLAAWLRDGRRCQTYLDETIAIDLGDSFQRAAAGVHLAALGGLWQVVLFGLAGFKFFRDRIEFDPFLPAGVTRLAFTLPWQGRRVHARIIDGAIEIGIEGAPCSVRVNHDERRVEPGRPASFQFDPAVTYWTGRREGAADG